MREAPRIVGIADVDDDIKSCCLSTLSFTDSMLAPEDQRVRSSHYFNRLARRIASGHVDLPGRGMATR